MNTGLGQERLLDANAPNALVPKKETANDQTKKLQELSAPLAQTIPVKKSAPEKKSAMWKFLEKFLKDEWPLRKTFALGNETAEGLRKLMFNWLPKPLASALYGALWSLAIVSTGGRVAANAKYAPKPEDKSKAGFKMLLHDGIAAIGLPTAWIRLIADPVQEKIYKAIKLPSALADVVRSAINIGSCYFLIGALDEPAKKLSAKLTGYSEDHHKEVNQRS
ncbi:MAG: hypothetical protein HOA17_06705 [Candidatus Melainabacteria bacterium]|nr:hypothetical protein [Candidatus Melainabacteria bacterium]